MSTSSAFAYATFLTEETIDEAVVEKIGMLDYFGLSIIIRRSTPLTVKQLYGIINKIKPF
jgi:hypothetical protein